MRGRKTLEPVAIAIDGPAGAGKSTVARKVAQQLAYIYIDTGAIYRAVAWAVNEQQITLCDHPSIAVTATNLQLELSYTAEGQQRVIVSGQDITQKIRTPEISRTVAAVAKIPAVRQALLGLQRSLAAKDSVVMDGRDIGTCVLPAAQTKIFLTASIEQRAKRRWLELQAQNSSISLEQLTQEIAERDRVDQERDVAPLIQAPDAIYIDTSALTIEETVAVIIKLHKEHLGA